MRTHQLDHEGAAGPWASLLLALPAVLLYLTPELTAWATLDRAAIAAGEVWRLMTGHWTHWSGEHLGWDLLVFAFVGGVLELRGRRRAFLICTVLSALLISGGVWVLRPAMAEYRGLSGIDCALVTLVAVDLLRESIRDRRRGLSLALTGLLVGYVGKVTFEFTTGQTVFVAGGEGLFVPVPLAHVVGGAVGIALGLVTPSCRSPTERLGRPRPPSRPVPGSKPRTEPRSHPIRNAHQAHRPLRNGLAHDRQPSMAVRPV